MLSITLVFRKNGKIRTGQVQTYWGERMLGARTRTRRAAKRNEMERFRISEIKKGPHAP